MIIPDSVQEAEQTKEAMAVDQEHLLWGPVAFQTFLVCCVKQLLDKTQKEVLIPEPSKHSAAT